MFAQTVVNLLIVRQWVVIIFRTINPIVRNVEIDAVITRLWNLEFGLLQWLAKPL